MTTRVMGLLIVWALILGAGMAGAHDVLVEKKTFALPSYTTVNGQTIRDVKIGYETYGTLNAARDNVILICHFYSGNSHAAGKYEASDPAPGYWDSIIGAGKPVDTDRFFVISSDTLVNLNTKDPRTVTTGPASINPDTGKPYGMTFPIVTIRDFVNVQKALLRREGRPRRDGDGALGSLARACGPRRPATPSCADREAHPAARAAGCVRPPEVVGYASTHGVQS